jgi:hypothetical protein
MKKRLIISESDRESILKLHNDRKNSLLKEQASTQQPVPQQPTSERFLTAKCPGKDTKPGQTCNEKVLKLQVKINDKCPTDKLPTKLKEDGVIGNNTKNAMTACDSFIRVNVTNTPVVNTPSDNASSNNSLTIDSLSV